MNTPTEPEGGSLITTIVVKDNSGNPWSCTVEHNGKKVYTDRKGQVKLHINGGALRIHGVPINVQKNVQKGVENIFRHNSGTGRIEKVESTISKNIPLTHYEGSQE